MTDYVIQIASVLFVIFLTIIIKVIDHLKFRNLVGSNKAIWVIIILIGIVEATYLAISLNLVQYVLEMVTSLSAILIFFAFVYLNKLQNAAAGLSIALGSKIKVGDKIEIEDKKGVVLQIGLTKTLVDVDENRKMWIPNKKFDEQIAYIASRRSDYKVLK